MYTYVKIGKNVMFALQMHGHGEFHIIIIMLITDVNRTWSACRKGTGKGKRRMCARSCIDGGSGWWMERVAI